MKFLVHKHVCPKKNFGAKFYFWSNKKCGPKIIFNSKKLFFGIKKFQKNFGEKNCLPPKNPCFKNIAKKNFGWKKKFCRKKFFGLNFFLLPKNFWSKKNFRSKEILVRKFFRSNTILGPKQFWVRKIFWFKKNLVPKKCLVGIDSSSKKF